MSKGGERDASGKFARGHSGNPAGARLRKPRALLTTTDLHRIQLEVAGEVIGRLNGKPVTRYENAVRSLARGDGENRLAARDHIELTKSATYHFEALKRADARKKPGS